MECPHCSSSFHPDFYYTSLWDRQEVISEKDRKHVLIYHKTCPECGQYIVYLAFRDKQVSSSGPFRTIPADRGATLVYPKGKYKTLSDDVPPEYVKDYVESYNVLDNSPKASAALSRRLLQRLLEDKGNVKKADLYDEIQEVMDSKQLPTHLSESIDAIRNTGNFAAHPTKSKASSEIVDVEPGEAEWNLAVLEGLFDFYFVQPAQTQRRKDSLNEKLLKFGKSPMK
jgi:hypothetical protein